MAPSSFQKLPHNWLIQCITFWDFFQYNALEIQVGPDANSSYFTAEVLAHGIEAAEFVCSWPWTRTVKLISKSVYMWLVRAWVWTKCYGVKMWTLSAKYKCSCVRSLRAVSLEWLCVITSPGIPEQSSFSAFSPAFGIAATTVAHLVDKHCVLTLALISTFLMTALQHPLRRLLPSVAPPCWSISPHLLLVF